MTEREKLIEYIVTYTAPEKISLNRMGCNESWYDSYYAIKQTFSLEELQEMSPKEVENLVKLGNNISEHLY